MGSINYNGGRICLSDRDVALVDAATRQLFLMDRSFTLMIAGFNADGTQAARSIWMSPHIPIQFDYVGYATTEINREYLTDLITETAEDRLYLLGDGDLPYELVGDGPTAVGDPRSGPGTVGRNVYGS